MSLRVPLDTHINPQDLDFNKLGSKDKMADEVLSGYFPKTSKGEFVRSDMHKVVTERPRHGHSNRSRKWGCRVAADYEGATFVSSARRRQYSTNWKEFSDFLAPLRRYLQGQVGRPWDKVYSEIRKAIPNGLHGDHLWMHIKWEVEINCFEREGRVFARPRYFYRDVEVSGLYVHPRTRLLCYKAQISRSRLKQVVEPVDRIEIGENEEYRKIVGVWYYQKFVRLDIAGPPVLELIRKKQLNRHELRDLRNAHPEIEGATPPKASR